VYNKYHTDTPKNAVYVGRGSPYGNPFIIGQDGNRVEVIKRFENEILPTLDVSNLVGKPLVCYCYPKICHADSLARKANNLA
jgi:hypothetical protein